MRTFNCKTAAGAFDVANPTADQLGMWLTRLRKLNSLLAEPAAAVPAVIESALDLTTAWQGVRHPAAALVIPSHDSMERGSGSHGPRWPGCVPSNPQQPCSISPMLPIADTIARASWHGEGGGDYDYDAIYGGIGGIYDSCDDYDYRSDDHDDR